MLGLAACLLLTTWIRYELSYDNFHDQSDRLYRALLYSLPALHYRHLMNLGKSPDSSIPPELSMLITIVIACLELLVLVAFATAQKTREIG